MKVKIFSMFLEDTIILLYLQYHMPLTFAEKAVLTFNLQSTQ